MLKSSSSLRYNSGLPKAGNTNPAARPNAGLRANKLTRARFLPALSRALLPRKAAQRQQETKASSPEYGIVIRSKLAAVGFDDGLAHKQAHPHAGFLGREKTAEELPQIMRINTRPAILKRTRYPRIGQLRSNKKSPLCRC